MVISLIPNQRVDTIHASQFDTSRTWEFQLISNDSVYTPTDTAEFICDGEEIPMEIDGNTVSCDSALLTNKSGIFPCKIKLTEGDEVLYSSLFYLHVEAKP